MACCKLAIGLADLVGPGGRVTRWDGLECLHDGAKLQVHGSGRMRVSVLEGLCGSEEGRARIAEL